MLIAGGPPANVGIWLRSYVTFCSCDLDLDQMTLTYRFDLDILKMYLHTKNELSRPRLSKVRARTGQTDRQTDATERITTPDPQW